MTLANREAHGVYVDQKKIASLGLRIRKGCSYHGFSLNINMDLEPYQRINPCGYAGLEMTQVQELCSIPPSITEISIKIHSALALVSRHTSRQHLTVLKRNKLLLTFLDSSHNKIIDNTIYNNNGQAGKHKIEPFSR